MREATCCFHQRHGSVNSSFCQCENCHSPRPIKALTHTQLGCTPRRMCRQGTPPAGRQQHTLTSIFRESHASFDGCVLVDGRAGCLNPKLGQILDVCLLTTPATLSTTALRLQRNCLTAPGVTQQPMNRVARRGCFLWCLAPHRVAITCAL